MLPEPLPGPWKGDGAESRGWRGAGLQERGPSCHVSQRPLPPAQRGHPQGTRAAAQLAFPTSRQTPGRRRAGPEGQGTHQRRYSHTNTLDFTLGRKTFNNCTITTPLLLPTWAKYYNSGACLVRSSGPRRRYFRLRLTFPFLSWALLPAPPPRLVTPLNPSCPGQPAALQSLQVVWLEVFPTRSWRPHRVTHPSPPSPRTA